MKEYLLKDDIKVFCVTAKSFPDGVQQAFITLEKMLSKEGRTFYGISHGTPSGEIIYKAAVTEKYEGEGKEYDFESYIIPMGKYITETIRDFMNNMNRFGEIFKEMLAHPQLDKSSACVEWYKTDSEVMCMVKLIS
ncbi:MAG: hypothetical protein ABIN97_08265 [Ginsengibacter sp.]